MAEMPKMEVEVELTWKRNERTSARVAKIAAKVLAMDLPDLSRLTVAQWRALWNEVQALAASALTQAADKSKRNRRPK